MDISSGIPRKITPDPVSDAVVEIRFSSTYPENLIFGMLYEKVKENFPTFEKTNIIPQLRIADPRLANLPEANVKNSDYSIGIGSKSIIFSCIGSYKGGDNFYGLINEKLQILFKDDKFFKKIDRIGMRYVNLFIGHSDVKSVSNINVSFENMISYNQVSFNNFFSLEKNDLKFNLRMVDKARNKITGKTGVLIDIEVFYDKGVNDNFENQTLDIIKKLHQEEKNLFFSVLKKEVVDSLNPEW